MSVTLTDGNAGFVVSVLGETGDLRKLNSGDRTNYKYHATLTQYGLH